jgi:hypothetical protein
MIVSKFKKNYICISLLSVGLSLLSMTAANLLISFSWLFFVFMVAVVVVGMLVWAFLLKTITVLNDGLEVRLTVLPSIRHFYRFAEFDYSQMTMQRGDVAFQLIRNGQRVVSISSMVYANFSDLIEAIPVRDKSRFTPRPGAEVVSSFRKPMLWIGGGFFALMFLMMLAAFVHGILVDEPLRRIIVIAVCGFVFGAVLVVVLSSHRFLTVWNGQVVARHLLWPFKEYFYNLSEFDGNCHVVIKANGNLGSKDEECWWLVKNKRVVLTIPESVYANYEALKDATRIKFLGHLEITELQNFQYQLHKKIDFL